MNRFQSLKELRRWQWQMNHAANGQRCFGTEVSTVVFAMRGSVVQCPALDLLLLGNLAGTAGPVTTPSYGDPARTAALWRVGGRARLRTGLLTERLLPAGK